MEHTAFYHLDHFPLLPEKFIDPAATANYEIPQGDSTELKVLRSFHCDAPKFKKIRLCYDLYKAFGNIETHYNMNLPMSLYDWHQDLGRKVGINWLLTEQDSYTLWKFPLQEGVRLQHKLESLVYTKLYSPVILDTSILHCVFNLAPTPRYILSIGFSDMSVKFADVKEFFKTYIPTDPYN